LRKCERRMPPAKIAVLEKIEMTDKQRKRLEALGNVEWYDSSTPAECLKRVKGASVVVVDWIDPNPFLSEMEPGFLLELLSTAYSWVDVQKAKKLGIRVANIPAYSTEAVAEHNLGLMLAVAKKIAQGDRSLHSGSKEKELRGFELKGKTLGIIGFGNIGKRVSELARGFGMDILTYNRHPKNVPGVRDVPLEELLQKSDGVCVTCSLNDDSKGLLGLDQLKLMKKEAVLVATTWGVIDTSALAEVLRNKLICGAGLDVEKDDVEVPAELLKLDNLVLTPHLAYNTRESKIRQVDTCLANIEAYLKGKPQNLVN